eukprot:SAG11_NODE_11176_length_778_cov_7.007364_2_plen_187_part_00
MRLGCPKVPGRREGKLTAPLSSIAPERLVMQPSASLEIRMLAVEGREKASWPRLKYGWIGSAFGAQTDPVRPKTSRLISLSLLSRLSNYISTASTGTKFSKVSRYFVKNKVNRLQGTVHFSNTFWTQGKKTKYFLCMYTICIWFFYRWKKSIRFFYLFLRVVFCRCIFIYCLYGRFTYRYLYFSCL